MKKQTWITLILAVALAISLTVNAVLWIMWPKDAAKSPMIDPVDTTTTTTAVKKMSDIETPYGTVQFPASFENVRHQATENDGTYTLTFSYTRGEEVIEMFSVHFGNEGMGTLIGFVNKDGVNVPFTVSSCEAPDDSAWSEQEKEHFKALMIAVNDVIASVEAWENFLG